MGKGNIDFKHINEPKKVEALTVKEYKEEIELAIVPITAQQWVESIAAHNGWNGDQISCWDTLINNESGFRVDSYNNSSGATGLGQALPASKMAAFGDDYLTSAKTQLLWMADYLKGNHGGSPCSNLAFWYNPTSPPYGQNWY